MAHITNKINRESLKPGDHIYAYRKLHTYSHHGIFIGGDRVIHYNTTREGNTSKRGNPCKNCGVDKNHLRGVVQSCVECFLKGHSLRRYEYDVRYHRYLSNWPGTCTTGQCHPPELTISRANDLFNKKDGFGDYNLFENNCEAFAVFCKTEKRVSDQVSSAILTIKVVINIGVKVARERLLNDVLVHHGQEKHDELKHRFDRWIANMSSLKEIISILQRDQEGNQLDHDHQRMR